MIGALLVAGFALGARAQGQVLLSALWAAAGTLVLVLTSGGKSLTADVQFEEMDVAFAAYVEMDSPIISLLKTGTEVAVALKGTDLPPRMVSLKGSTAAIDTLIDACK